MKLIKEPMIMEVDDSMSGRDLSILESQGWQRLKTEEKNMDGYEVVYKVGRLFFAYYRDPIKWFLGLNCNGYYKELIVF